MHQYVDLFERNTENNDEKLASIRRIISDYKTTRITYLIGFLANQKK